jgi:hypothetical protein
MAFRDGLKNNLVEGDPVAIALGNGQLVNGTVVKTSALVAAPNQPQFVVVQFGLVMPAGPDGTVPGLFKLATPPQTGLSE